MDLGYLALGMILIIVGLVSATSGRRTSKALPPAGEKASGSPLSTVGMFLLGLGLVFVVIGL